MTPVVYGTVLLAWVNPTLVAGFLWVAMFDFYYGSLNQSLELLGFGPVSWLGTAPMLSVVIVNIWRGTAFVMIIFLGGLTNHPNADLRGGAGRWCRSLAAILGSHVAESAAHRHPDDALDYHLDPRRVHPD